MRIQARGIIATMFDADRYGLEAKECRDLAAKSQNPADQEAWLKLAADWIKLAEDKERNRMRYGD